MNLYFKINQYQSGNRSTVRRGTFTNKKNVAFNDDVPYIKINLNYF